MLRILEREFPLPPTPGLHGARVRSPVWDAADDVDNAGATHHFDDDQRADYDHHDNGNDSSANIDLDHHGSAADDFDDFDFDDVNVYDDSGTDHDDDDHTGDVSSQISGLYRERAMLQWSLY